MAKSLLVACEESQEVTKAFRDFGINAFSCDIVPCSGGFPEWHIQDDVLNVLGFRWDAVIGFPPCTYLTKAGSQLLWFSDLNRAWVRIPRFIKGLNAKRFFLTLYNHPCGKVVLENPTPLHAYKLPLCSQVIEPYHFGHPYTKRTQLWIKGFPPLFATDIVEPVRSWVFTSSSACHRSKTFPGVADAMAMQWHEYI